MSTDTLAKILETNSSVSSWASTGVLTSPDNTSTASEDTNVQQPPLTSATTCVTGSHTFRFNRYSRRAGFEVGKYLASDTFTADGYDWAITLYPNAKKYQYKDYISLYIRLESEETHVNAEFELTLVDQSGRGKHTTHTQFGFLMRRRGSQWGFGQYMKKKYLEKLGYLKDDCLVVKCVVGVLAFDTELEITAPNNFISSYLPSSLENETIEEVKEFLGMKDTKLLDLESAAKIIIEFESPLQLQGLVNDGDRGKFDQYLYAVDEIQQSIRSGISGYDTHRTCAIKKLQLLFQKILDCSVTGTKSDAMPMSTTVYSSSVTSSYNYELQGSNQTGHGELSRDQVCRLSHIVERLNSTGCLGDCINMYRISRKSAVDARYLRFCIGKWTYNDLQSLDCQEFTAKITAWILAANKCYNTIFPEERQYYEKIFDGVGAVTYDNCFLAIVKHAAIELNNFADAVSCTASFQKLFPVLDLYKVLVVILPKIQNVFHSVSVANISYGASNIINKLATLLRKLFSSFQDTVLNEQMNTLPPKGTVHSLTEYAMRYVTSIALHKELLTNIIVSPPTVRLGNQADKRFLEASSGTPLRLHMISIMISLRINLEGKSSLYGDSSLSHVFIMNNVNYMIKTITGSPELLEMIGKEYPSKLSKDVLQAAQNYTSSIWHRVLYCLRDEGLSFKFPLYNGISKISVKNRFKTFNTTFEEICQTQSTMSVLDIQLRGQIHKLILAPKTDDSIIPGFQDMKDSNCEDTKFPHMELAAKKIIESGSPLNLEQLINDGCGNKLNKYLYAVDEIQRSIKSGLINSSETHGSCALETQKPVFQEILECSINAINYDALSSVCSSTVSSTYGYDLQGSNHTGHGDLSSEQVNCLRNIGEGLNWAECLGDFIEAYRYSRKSAVDARCRRFCISKWTSNDLQNLDCEEFTTEIKIWIQTAKFCYNSIFPREKQYIEQIFGGVSGVTQDNFFVAIVENVAIELNSFAGAVSSIASFQKLFDVLDMYKVLFLILPTIQNMFRYISCTNICHGATTAFCSLANVVRKLFSSFEDTVLNELSNTLPPEGTIHSLTEYAMNYVTSISLYKEILTNIIISHPTKSLGNRAHELFLEGSGGTPLGRIWMEFD